MMKCKLSFCFKIKYKNKLIHFIYSIFRYQIILDCWHFKSDMRPSFTVIDDKLNIILEKYEQKKLQLTKLIEMENLLDNKPTNLGLTLSNQLGRTFINLTSRSAHLNQPTLQPSSSPAVSSNTSSVLPSVNNSLVLPRKNSTNGSIKNNSNKYLNNLDERIE